MLVFGGEDMMLKVLLPLLAAIAAAAALVFAFFVCVGWYVTYYNQ